MAESARSQPADLRHRRRVVAPDAEPRSAFRRARRARPPLRAARLAQARRGREPGDGKPRIRRRAIAARARNRRGAHARQVRRRLHLARPSAAVPLRRDADRRFPGPAQLVRRAFADPAFDRRHGARDRDGGHLRGRGDGIRRSRARPARLPVRARGRLRPADERGRRAQADGRRGSLSGPLAIGAGLAFPSPFRAIPMSCGAISESRSPITAVRGVASGVHFVRNQSLQYVRRLMFVRPRSP